MPEVQNLLVRATNWIGDAVMSLPALRAVRHRFPQARITVLARPWVADLYRRESFADAVVLYAPRPGWRDAAAKWSLARQLRDLRCDAALLLPNSFESAAVCWAARIPHRLGYARDGRGPLLTTRVPAPRPGEIPRFEAYYYLELLRRLGWIDSLPAEIVIRLEGAGEAARAGRDRLAALGIGGTVAGVSPGAAYGTAKRWLPERFAEAAVEVARHRGASIAVFGSVQERPLCEAVCRHVARAGVPARNLAGETALAHFIELAAACRVFLTNDSGAMHIASALGVPTVAVFGATDETATGPTGPLARVVREPVDCAPCLRRECPIDHRCMTRVSANRVAAAALELLK